MVKTFEPEFKIATFNKRKWMLRLNQNGKGSRWRIFNCMPTQSEYFPVNIRDLTSRHFFGWNLETLYDPRAIEKVNRKEYLRSCKLEMSEKAKAIL